MFCAKCGTKLSDEAKFCNNCGAKTSNSDNSASQVTAIGNQDSRLVPAKCTNCGGQLTVNENQKSAICPFCNSSFIVEQAINNYNVQINGNMSIGNATININGVNTANLVARANAFESQNDFDAALEYYDRVLDIDINNVDAIQGIQRIRQKQKDQYIQTLVRIALDCESRNDYNAAKSYFLQVMDIDDNNQHAISGYNRIEQKIKDYVFIAGKRKTLLGKTEFVEVRRDKISILKENGEIVQEYYINSISNERYQGGQIIFNYPGKDWFPVKFSLRDKTYEIFVFIKNAKAGIYPEYSRI